MARFFTIRARFGVGLGVTFAIVLLILLMPVRRVGDLRAQATDPCATVPVNPIACENSKPGNPASQWDISGAGSSSIEGFATNISVNKGQTVGFKVKTSASSYRIDIYRLGYYAGNGARLIAQITNPTVRTQPACLTNSASGLVDCGNWTQTASWAVPSTAVSGIYIAKLVAGTAANHMVFIVRDDSSLSPILFQTSDTTWQAYNRWGGNSLYVGNPAGRAFKVSYNRPFSTRGTTPEDWLFNAEYPMVRWLEANGYNVSYTTGVDSDRRGAEILEHKVFLSVGHDEYWSGAQRTNVEAARAAGVNLAFFSGNEVFWKTRWENSIDGTNTTYRTLVCYKETHANAKIDPLNGVWTGTWRDARFSPPDDGGRPENALTGTLFTVNGVESRSITIPEALGKLRFWRNTTVATLPAGGTATLPSGVLGYEWDEDVDNGVRPPGMIKLSSTTANVPGRLVDNGSTFAAGTATHNLVLYRHSSGALVFGAGTVQWTWGLDSNHDRAGTASDVRMQQATMNLLADMGVQPSTRQAALVAATASTDVTAPTAVITSPTAGANVPGGTNLSITGTASDSGGVVAAVEVSVDNGATWRMATGTTSWTFTWATPTNSNVTIRARGIDDSGNVQSPGASVAVTVGTGGGGGTSGLVAAYSFSEGTGTTTADASGANNNGALSNTTWTTAGKNGNALSFNGTSSWMTVADSATLDLTGALTMEAWVRPTTVTNWRTVMMKETPGSYVYGLYAHDGSRPAFWANINSLDQGLNGTSALAANTWTHLAATFDGSTMRLYVNGTQVSSRTATGPLGTSAGVLRIGGNSIWNNEFFSGLIDDVRVYARVLTANEIQTDMNTPVAGDTTPPVVSTVAPAANAVNVSPSTTVTATFNKSMLASSIDTTTFQLRDAAALLVPGTVSYNAATLTATFAPSAALTAGGVYTATVRGGAADPRVKDSSGNAMASDATWSFTVTLSSDSTPPTASNLAPANGVTGVPVSTTVSATFSEAMDATTITAGTFELRQGATLIPATVTYDAASRVVTLSPSSLLSQNVVYTAQLRGGTTDPRIKDAAGNALAANVSWSFTTAITPANDGPGGPILVVASTANPFTRYYGEILRNEGFNLFTTTDISLVTATMLNSYDVVVLGDMALTPAQVTLFTNWVTAGGNLIAMKPDKQLAGLLGLTDAGTTVSNGYLLIAPSGPGTGIVNQTIQFHGTADRYTLNGASSLATLYSSATTALANPAVTLRSVGSNGGQVAAFAFDLARSVVYTRQGNPAWAGQERDGIAPVRSDDMFFGGSSADWVDLNKVAIPQADEQQRLLANMIIQMGLDKKPLPRFWYLPRFLKAAVVMTGDDHANNGTQGRFNAYAAQSVPGCNVANWECIRATSYIYPSTPLTSAQATAFANAGFEVALHLSTGCGDYTASSIASDLNSQLATFAAKYTGVPAPVTNRTHCIAFSDWASQPLAEAARNIRLDTNYYYWPGEWVQNRPGHFTGSGMPMRFANLDGTTIDVYQAATQMTDESNLTYSTHINALLDRALGAEGYYAVVTTNMHTDTVEHEGSDAIIASAVARGIPVVSAKQLLTWLDGRNGSSFGSLAWSNGVLTFTVTTATGANGLYAMLPAAGSSGPLVSLTRGGSAVSYTLQTIKGVQYAVFAAAAGSYSASYVAAPDTTITSTPPATTTSTSAVFTFTSTPSGASFQCSIDGSAYTSCASGVTYTGLAAGNHNFAVRAVNSNGTDPTPASFAWSIVVDVPETTITSAAPSTSSTSATFTFTSTPAGATFECSLDGAAFAACASGVTYSPLTYASHTFDVRAVNAAGTDPTPATVSWTIVMPVPDTTITTNPGTTTTSTTASFSFTATPATGASFECSLDGAAYATCTSPQVYSGLALGAHAFSVRAVNAAGTDPSPATFNWTVSTSGCPCTLFAASAVPGTPAANDTGAVELGMKFQTDRNGFITAIRFYKGTGNTGTHVGHLWSSTGTLLATATFTSETASGWQQVPLATPVAVTANTTYVVSYFAPVGRYAFDGGYFNSQVTNAPLRGLSTSGGGGNGVYRYGTTSGFPNSTFNAANYWVDVVFADQ